MKIVSIFSLLVLHAAMAQAQYQYPLTRTVDSTDTYWGVTVKDPYRWLENLKDPAVTGWFKAQADYTNTELSKISGTQHIIHELTELDKVQSIKYYPLTKIGLTYFYQKRLPGEAADKLYFRNNQGVEILLFDPATYIHGEVVDAVPSVSFDGKYVLLNIARQGAEINDVRILDVQNRTLLPDVLPHANGEFVAGTHDKILYRQHKGYDTHDPENNLNMKTFLHIVGDPVNIDKLIFSREKYPDLRLEAADWPSVRTYENCPYLFASKETVDRNQQLFYAPLADLEKEKIHWKVFCKKEDEIRKIFPHGSDIYCLTPKENNLYRIIKTSLKNVNLSRAKEIYAGKNDWKISHVEISRDFLIIEAGRYDLELQTKAYEFKTGKITDIKPALTANTFFIPLSANSNECFAVNAGWNIPYRLYEYDLENKQLSKPFFHTTANYKGIETLTYKEVEITSHDGTMVPLSIIYDSAAFKADGSNIAFLSGYGAYGSTTLPFFSETYMPLLKRGVVLAVAHVRGGGEKGNDWYQAGKKTTKPNTWKDFNACAEYLISHRYTSASRLGCSGASAGGILIGRAITERPDLYKVAIPKVGCLNNLRMEFSPNGPGNIPEFGTVRDSLEFFGLLEMDALYHVKKGVHYPAQLITTGFNDPRVESYFPAKFAAGMQAANASSNPVFLYVDYAGGHFGGTTTKEKFAQTAMEYSFLLWQCGDKDFQLK